MIMGLPGAGKTTLAAALVARLGADQVTWFNADQVRRKYNDWDFSESGRVRQSTRMREMADSAETVFVICDFVAPLQQQRDTYAADITVWMDTVSHSSYADTDAVFQVPNTCDFRITEKDAEKWAKIVCDHLNKYAS